MAFKGGVVLGTISFNATGSGTTNIAGTSNSGTLQIGNGSSSTVTIDCGTAGISVGATANAHTATFGSTNSTSATTLQSGSGALNVTATNGALTINAGTGTLGIATDSSANTVNIATGGAVKTLTVGSTNTTSSTAIKSGSGNVAINSGLTIDSSGRWKSSVQPCFLVQMQTTTGNITGDGTAADIQFDTTTFDNGSNITLNSSGKTIFTAPVTGKYQMNLNIVISGSFVSTNNTSQLRILATSRTFFSGFFSPFTDQATGHNLTLAYSVIVDMSANDTASLVLFVSGSAKDVAVLGPSNSAQVESCWSGYLIC